MFQAETGSTWNVNNSIMPTYRKILLGNFNPFIVRQKLNTSKYDLVIYGFKIKVIVTNIHNREVVLKDLINVANDFAKRKSKQYTTFKIYLTEDGIKSVLFDSKIHKKSIILD